MFTWTPTIIQTTLRSININQYSVELQWPPFMLWLISCELFLNETWEQIWANVLLLLQILFTNVAEAAGLNFQPANVHLNSLFSHIVASKTYFWMISFQFCAHKTQISVSKLCWIKLQIYTTMKQNTLVNYLPTLSVAGWGILFYYYCWINNKVLSVFSEISRQMSSGQLRWFAVNLHYCVFCLNSVLSFVTTT